MLERTKAGREWPAFVFLDGRRRSALRPRARFLDVHFCLRASMMNVRMILRSGNPAAMMFDYLLAEPAGLSSADNKRKRPWDRAPFYAFVELRSLKAEEFRPKLARNDFIWMEVNEFGRRVKRGPPL